MTRLLLPVVFLSGLALILAQWHWENGFLPLDPRWWTWLAKTIRITGTLPDGMLYPVWWTGAGSIVAMLIVLFIASRASSSTVTGGRNQDELHGSAKWAKRSDVAKADLFTKRGVVVGGWPGLFRTKTLRHDGPEHVMAFAPTRSGKGVGLILPTLLSWTHSAMILDIKGENYALTAGWRADQGQRILRFEPTAETGSVRFNPLAEVRTGTGRDIADCQNIASMIVDPEGKGLKDYWMQEGWSWLSVMILHVLYRVQKEEKRVANLSDVQAFASAAANDDGSEDGEADASFINLLQDMMDYDHGVDHVNHEVRRGASRMKIKAGQERSGVHSSGTVQLGLYGDPIVARNVETSDFRLDDLMKGEAPASLYLVIQPSDIDRLRPLVRVVLNLFLRRLTEGMQFEGGRSVANYKHRMLLMLDEFTSIGKLEIFEQSLAFMAGYGLKAFIIVQDLTQLQKAYGRENSIMANCHVRLAYAPNTIETARTLSDMTGKTTVVQRKRSRSGRLGELGSVSDSLNETSRPLLTPDECMRLKALRKDRQGETLPGDMLIFVAGSAPILGRQALYFQSRALLKRARMAPPSAPTPDIEETS
ncbi:MAG: type IV secretory system conjugative DNA transfer family protein [Rhodospirillum sp.]|nr:type IV secretory system conjugative DNA transfer family protein [Rhodospirillum sp.]